MSKEFKKTNELKKTLIEKANSLKQNQTASLNKDYSFKMGFDGFKPEFINNPFIKKVTVDNTKENDNISLSVYRDTVLSWLSNNYESDLKTIQTELVLEMGTDGIKAFNGYVNAKLEQHATDILSFILKA